MVSGNSNLFPKDLSRDNISLNTSRVSQRSRGTQARVDAAALFLVDALQGLLSEQQASFSLSPQQVIKVHLAFMKFHLNRKESHRIR